MLRIDVSPDHLGLNYWRTIQWSDGNGIIPNFKENKRGIFSASKLAEVSVTRKNTERCGPKKKNLLSYYTEAEKRVQQITTWIQSRVWSSENIPRALKKLGCGY